MNLACVICGFNSGSEIRRTAGCVAFSWCICLFLFTGVCCWIPFCTFNCMDVEIICRRCGYVKLILQAECFWAMGFFEARKWSYDISFIIYKNRGWAYSISSEKTKTNNKKPITILKQFSCQLTSHKRSWNSKCRFSSKNRVIWKLFSNSMNFIGYPLFYQDRNIVLLNKRLKKSSAFPS